MAGRTIGIEGLEELVTALTKASVLAQARAAASIARTAKRVEATARQRAPRGPTGRLHRSIHSTISGTSAEIGPSARYGAFVEYGTFKDAPQPYMGPAADAHEGELVRGLERLVGDL